MRVYMHGSFDLIRWSAFEGVPSLFDLEPSSEPPIGLLLNCATTCVGIGGMIYSNLLESIARVNTVNLTGHSGIIRKWGLDSESEVARAGCHLSSQTGVRHGSKFPFDLLRRVLY